ELISRAEDAIAERKRGRRAFGPPRAPVRDPAERRELALALAPRLRGLLSRPRRMIVTFDDSPEVTAFVSSAEAATVSQIGPATPDHTISPRRLPCYADVPAGADSAALSSAVERSLETFARDYTSYVDAHRPPDLELSDALPRVVLLPGIGMFTSGRDRRT